MQFCAKNVAKQPTNLGPP